MPRHPIRRPHYVPVNVGGQGVTPLGCPEPALTCSDARRMPAQPRGDCVLCVCGARTPSLSYPEPRGPHAEEIPHRCQGVPYPARAQALRGVQPDVCSHHTPVPTPHLLGTTHLTRCLCSRWVVGAGCRCRERYSPTRTATRLRCSRVRVGTGRAELQWRGTRLTSCWGSCTGYVVSSLWCSREVRQTSRLSHRDRPA